MLPFRRISHYCAYMRTAPRTLNHDPEAVRWAVTRSGLTQSDLAARVGVSPGHMSEILAGTRNARQALLLKIAAEINCPVVILEAKQVAS